MEIVLNLYNGLGRTDIFTVLCFLIHEHSMLLYLFSLSLIYYLYETFNMSPTHVIFTYTYLHTNMSDYK